MYQSISKLADKFFTKAQIFKYGFNLSPMYKRSTGKITNVSDNLYNVQIKIKRSWKNKNYVGSIFGGSLFSATDPIYMIQLINILGDSYVVWDKATQIKFRKPAYSDAYALFSFTEDEISDIKNKVSRENEIDYVKELSITDDKKNVFCQLQKTLYIADKSFYKEKMKKRKSEK